MRPVAAVGLGAAAGGIVAGGIKVFLLNTGPEAVGRTDWFLVTWLAAALAGMLAAALESPLRGLIIGLVVAIAAGVLLESSPLQPAPINKPLAQLVTAGACLIAGMVGGMIGRAVRRPAARRSPPREREVPD